MDNKQLAYALAECESERQVIEILKREKKWDNPQCWRAFGDNENNWSTIGNQQSEADAALVEKIVNSIDAILMKECLRRKIAPNSPDAPKSIAAALELYFGIHEGKIQDITQNQRTELAQGIVLAATGFKPSRDGENKYPNLTLVDCGEGQSPEKMPDTILSINKSNKLKVPFVQGKFNMGGTGILRFCGEQNFQLIISRRCPEIVCGDDKTENLWGVTLVRRERPTNGRRSSVFTYLVGEDNNILSFEENQGITVIPTSSGQKKNMEYGMLCKLFEFKMNSRLCSNINMALYNRLSTLLPNLAYPVLLDECRDYKGHTMFRTLSGLNVRLADQTQNIENSSIETTLSAKFTIDSQKLDATIYVFKKTTAKGVEVDTSQFRTDEGIILTQNGQTHGSFDKKFYKRNAVGLSYLSDHILTIVDCSQIDEKTREDLFMNSRDRMSASSFAKELEHSLEEFFKENEVLKAIQAKRREEAISNKLDDEKPLEDVLATVFKSSSVLSRLFITGERLQNPVALGKSNGEENYKGLKNPTYFTIMKKKAEEVYQKSVQLGRKFRIRFKTDAENDFFSRDEYPGEYILMCGDNICDYHSMNLYNGTAVLNIALPENANVGDRFNYTCIITDTMVEKEFCESFEIVVEEKKEDNGGNGGHRNPPNGDNPSKNSFAPTGIALPNVIEVSYDEWEENGFTKESALRVVKASSDEEIYDFYVNMDNIHLKSELKPIAKNDAKVKLLKARYKYGMVLMGLSILGYHSKKENEDIEQNDVCESIKMFSEMISPVLLPMIDVMGDDMSDIINE